MTVSVQTPLNTHSGNGSATSFPFTYRCDSASELLVYVDEVLKTYVTHYTLSGLGNGSGGTVNFVTAPANGAVVKIKRAVTLNRTTDLQEGASLPSSTIDYDFDKTVMMLQDVNANALLRDISGNIIVSGKLTSVSAGTVSTDGINKGQLDAAIAAVVADVSAEAAAAAIDAAEAARDQAQTYANNASTSASNSQTYANNASSYATAASNSASTASTHASNALTYKNDAQSSASTATTQANNAATSASNALTYMNSASTSASNANSSASSASTYATNASNSASAASGSASAASSSASTASTHASTALTHLQSFRAVYVGASSSAPSVDGNGDALTTGDIFYNTSSNRLQVYTGSGWDNAVDTAAGYVATSRNVSTSTGLQGGGNLTADRTLSFDTTWGDARYWARTALTNNNQLTNGSGYITTAVGTWTGTLSGQVSGTFTSSPTFGIESRNNSSGAATMAFHRQGAYAVVLGLDTDNVFKVGGWSDGTNTFRWTADASGNFAARGNVTGVVVYGTSYIYSYGTVYAQGDVIGYYSDSRLKDRVGSLTNALDKVNTLDTFTYKQNALGDSLYGHKDERVRVGVSAQQVQAVLPEAVALAPFDTDTETGKSKSGENYLTVQYERLVPLLIAAIQELNAKVEELKNDSSK